MEYLISLIVLAGLTQLISLNLDHNNLLQLPGTLGEITSLTELSFKHNSVNMIPEEVSHLTNLRVLLLSFNMISILPWQLHKLKNCLEIFDVENNALVLPPRNILDLPVKEILDWLDKNQENLQKAKVSGLGHV